MKIAGALHPPCRRKKLRPLRPRLAARTSFCSVPSSSPHKILDFAGPPFFLAKKKRECAVHGGREKKTKGNVTGARHGADCAIRKSPARGAVRAGVLAVIEWTSVSFRCRWPGAGLWGLTPFGRAMFSGLVSLLEGGERGALGGLGSLGCHVINGPLSLYDLDAQDAGCYRRLGGVELRAAKLLAGGGEG